jgi:hypothetical protein
MASLGHAALTLSGTRLRGRHRLALPYVTVPAPDRDGRLGAVIALIAHAPVDQRGEPPLTWEPVSGIEPLTCRLQDCGRSMASYLIGR